MEKSTSRDMEKSRSSGNGETKKRPALVVSLDNNAT